MDLYKIVKKDTIPTIALSNCNFDEGLILVVDENDGFIGIILFDNELSEYMFVNEFSQDFHCGVSYDYKDPNIYELMKTIKDDYDGADFKYLKQSL